MPERLMLEGFELFVGKHCESTALKRVLDYHGLSLSEEMLFGLSGGVGFIYWYIEDDAESVHRHSLCEGC